MDRYNKAEKKFLLTALKEEARTVLWQVNSQTDPAKLVESVLEDLQALAPRDDGTEQRSEEEIWTQVRERLLKAAYATRPYCVRCGTCCTKGSPTLLAQDFELLKSNILMPEHLFTLRKGEIAYSGQTEKLEPTETELIKIREVPGTRTCIFYEPKTKECTIYDSRPTQCRRLECWNPDAFQEAGDDLPIDRASVLRATGPLWDIIRRHEERCSHAELGRAMARLGATKGQTVEDVMELIRFDHHVRQFVSEKLNVSSAAMDFIFGRPLSETIRYYGLKVESQPDGSFLLTMIEE